jgi:hypothetical protein
MQHNKRGYSSAISDCMVSRSRSISYLEGQLQTGKFKEFHGIVLLDETITA